LSLPPTWSAALLRTTVVALACTYAYAWPRSTPATHAAARGPAPTTQNLVAGRLAARAMSSRAQRRPPSGSRTLSLELA